MSAVEAVRAVTLPWLLKRSALLSWFELPRVAAVGAIWLASLVPLVAAIPSGQWWLIGLSSLPVALVLTGISRFAAITLRGDRAGVRDALTTDPILALIGCAVGTGAGLLLSTEGLQVAGFVMAAAVVVVAPYALAYGAVRGRSGIAAWRGALILVAYRPSWALTVLAVTVLGGFVIVASVGALGLIVPAVLAVFAAGVVTELLRDIDSLEKGASAP